MSKIRGQGPCPFRGGWGVSSADAAVLAASVGQLTKVAVLWDFAWTLMAPESAGRWLARGSAEAGVRVPAEEQAAWAAKADGAAFPCPATPHRDLTPGQLAAWRHRELGPEIHESVYRGLLERARLP
jgi:hypothetical protein